MSLNKERLVCNGGKKEKRTAIPHTSQVIVVDARERTGREFEYNPAGRVSL